MRFLLSFKLLLAHCTVCYKLSMNIMLTIFDVSIKEKRVYGSLCFELLPQQVHGPVPACQYVQAGRVGDHILNI